MNKIILAGLAAVMALSGSALAASESNNPDRCLRPALIDGFQNATRDSVVLTQGGHKWRADTMGTCTGLDYANDIATKSRTNCFTAGDTIFFHDGGMRQTCMVKAVTYLPKEAAAK